MCGRYFPLYLCYKQEVKVIQLQCTSTHFAFFLSRLTDFLHFTREDYTDCSCVTHESQSDFKFSLNNCRNRNHCYFVKYTYNCVVRVCMWVCVLCININIATICQVKQHPTFLRQYCLNIPCAVECIMGPSIIYSIFTSLLSICLWHSLLIVIAYLHHVQVNIGV